MWGEEEGPVNGDSDLQVPGLGGSVDGIDSPWKGKCGWGLRFVGGNDEFGLECAEVSFPWGIHLEKFVAMFTTQACVAGEAWLLMVYRLMNVLMNISSFRSLLEKGMCPILSLL